MARRYFSNVLEALYMQQTFGVKFECDYLPEDDGVEESDGKSFPFEHTMLCAPEMLGDLLSDFEGFRKIYVKAESEAIFEPKEGDLVIFDPTENEPVFNPETRKIIYYKSRISPANNIMVLNSHYMTPYLLENILEILKRDNKQFFAPEVENV